MMAELETTGWGESVHGAVYKPFGISLSEQTQHRDPSRNFALPESAG